jgi:hypothetical protein
MLRKLIILLFVSVPLISCNKNPYENTLISPIENISYLFDFFIEQKYTIIIENDSLYKAYNLQIPKDSVVNQGIFYQYILKNCIDNSYGNYIKITNEKLFNQFIKANQKEILLDDNLQLKYQKTKTEYLLFLVNKQNFLEFSSVVDYQTTKNDTVIFNLKNEDLIKKYEVFQLEKPLFLIAEDQIIVQPQQIKINYVNKSVKIFPITTK